MCTSPLIQPAAASLEEAASARLAARANRTRSVSGLSRRPASVARTASSSPRRRHSWSRAWTRPAGRDPVTVSLPGSAAARAPAGVRQPRQRRDHAADRVRVELVLPAEVAEHPRARPACLRVPLVVGQLQVADRPGTGGPHGRLHVGHAPEATGTRTLGQIRRLPLVIFAELPM
jgi:hypothetical protein